MLDVRIRSVLLATLCLPLVAVAEPEKRHVPDKAPPSGAAGSARPAAEKTKASACHAVDKALGRIQSSMETVEKRGNGCFTCHHHSQTLETFGAAKKEGLFGATDFATLKNKNLKTLRDDLTPERITDSVRFSKIGLLLQAADPKKEDWTPADIRKIVARSGDAELKALDGETLDRLGNEGEIHGDVATASSALTALRLAGEKPDELSQELLRYLLAKQNDDGSWEPSEKRRVPSEGSTFQTTAATVLALGALGELGTKPENQKAFERGVKWLLDPPVPPSDTQDRTTYLSGLLDLKDSPALAAGQKKQVESRIAKELAALEKQQLGDGGFAQTPKMKSDAYATGQALTVLAKAGVPADDPTYAKGVEFLLGEQDKLGDFPVASRVEAQFENLFLINDPPSGNLTPEDVKLARQVQTEHKKQPDATRGGLNASRNDPKRGAAVDAHHRMHSQFVTFMANNWAAQALVPACVQEKKGSVGR